MQWGVGGRGTRWVVAVCVGAGAFAMVWWVAESWFGLDQSTAVTIAAAAASLVSTPFVWLAGQEGRTGGRPADATTVAEAEPTSSRSRTPVIIAVAVLVGLCGVAAFQSFVLDGSGGGNDGRRLGPEGAEGAVGDPQSLEVGATAWYAGFAFGDGGTTGRCGGGALQQR